MMMNKRLGCSTITYRRLPLVEALDLIASQGFAEADLGSLPGVCDHVPLQLDSRAVDRVVGEVTSSGVAVRSINADIGDLNEPWSSSSLTSRMDHLDRLLDVAVGVQAPALVLPCGALGGAPLVNERTDISKVAMSLAVIAERTRRHGVELWCETLHFFRLCNSMERAAKLTAALHGSGVGVVMDFSHIVASGADPVDFVQRFGPIIRHVHVRDAVPGSINLSVGRGVVDFGAGFSALREVGYRGHVSLELETHDIADDERPRETLEAAKTIGTLMSTRL